MAVVEQQRDPYLVASVVRCCRVLRAFRTKHDALPLRTIVQRTGLSKSLVFRLLHTLQRIRWIEKSNRTYRLVVHVPRHRISTADSKRGASLELPAR